jgi:hypothetical protein
MPGFANIIRGGKDAFCEQETHCEFAIVGRGAHRDRDGFLTAAVGSLEAYTNLERFLDRDVVVRLTVAFALNTPDRDVSTTIW